MKFEDKTYTKIFTIANHYGENQQTNKPGIPVLDDWLHSSLQGDKGLVTGVSQIRLNTKKARDNR